MSPKQISVFPVGMIKLTVVRRFSPFLSAGLAGTPQFHEQGDIYQCQGQRHRSDAGDWPADVQPAYDQ